MNVGVYSHWTCRRLAASRSATCDEQPAARSGDRLANLLARVAGRPRYSSVMIRRISATASRPSAAGPRSNLGAPVIVDDTVERDPIRATERRRAVRSVTHPGHGHAEPVAVLQAGRAGYRLILYLRKLPRPLQEVAHCGHLGVWA